MREFEFLGIFIYLIGFAVSILVMSILLIVQNIKINKKLEEEGKDRKEWLKKQDIKKGSTK